MPITKVQEVKKIIKKEWLEAGRRKGEKKKKNQEKHFI